MVEIPLTKGQVAVVDDSDSHLVRYRWYLSIGGYACHGFYDRNDGKSKSCFMHHVIIGRPLNKNQIDHVDGNRLNNRRNNLRIVTEKENHRNQKCHRGEKIKQSKYIGVYFNKKYKKWYAQIHVGKKNKHLGMFGSEEEAFSSVQRAVKIDEV